MERLHVVLGLACIILQISSRGTDCRPPQWPQPPGHHMPPHGQPMPQHPGQPMPQHPGQHMPPHPGQHMPPPPGQHMPQHPGQPMPQHPGQQMPPPPSQSMPQHPGQQMPHHPGQPRPHRPEHEQQGQFPGQHRPQHPDELQPIPDQQLRPEQGQPGPEPQVDAAPQEYESYDQVNHEQPKHDEGLTDYQQQQQHEGGGGGDQVNDIAGRHHDLPPLTEEEEAIVDETAVQIAEQMADAIVSFAEEDEALAEEQEFSHSLSSKNPVPVTLLSVALSLLALFH